MRWYPIFIAIVLSYPAGFAQERNLKFTGLQIPNSPKLSTKAIYHDSEGYIWLGTWHNLGRFDGNKIRYYSGEELSYQTFDNHAAKLIFEDSEKKLWIATDQGGLMVLNRDLDKFVGVNDSTTSLLTQASSFVESEGGFWFGTLGEGLVYYHPKTHAFRRFVHSPEDINSIPSNTIQKICKGPDHSLWLATDAGLCSFDVLSNKFTLYNLRELSNAFKVVYQSPDGNLYLGSSDGFHVFNYPDFFLSDYTGGAEGHKDVSAAFIRTPPSTKGVEVTGIIEGRNGIIWISTMGKGIFNFNKITGEINQIKENPLKEESLPSNFITNIYLDHADKLWASSSEDGIVLTDLRTSDSDIHRRVNKITYNRADPNSISKGNVYSIFATQDSLLWIGVNRGGLNRVNIYTGDVKKFVHIPNDPASLAHNTIEPICSDSNGNLWFGVYDNGVDKFNPSKMEFTHYIHREGENSIMDNSVNALLVDQEDKVWIGTCYGIDALDTKSNRIQHYKDDSLGISISGSSMVESRNFIWFIKSKQIVAFDKAKGRFSMIKKGDPNSPGIAGAESLPNTDDIIVLQSDGTLNKLSCIDEDLAMEELMKMNDIGILTMSLDRAGNIWALSSKKLIRIDPIKRTQMVVLTFDELPNDPIAPELYIDSQGRIFFSLIDEVSWIYPEDLTYDEAPAKIMFTDFKVFNNSVPLSQKASGIEGFTLPKHISRMEVVDLTYRESFFSLEFSALEFSNPRKVIYEYKLEGFDQQWISIGNRNYVSYTNLDPGTYTLKLRAAYQEGQWGKETSLGIRVHPPFWNTWWFISLEIILVLGLAYLFLRYKISQSLRLERLRNKIASDLHDEVGSSLTRISIYSDLLQNNYEKEKEPYLSTISNLSREIISTMSDIVWSIDNHNDSLGDLIIRMKEFALPMLEAKDIEAKFSTNDLDEKRIIDPIIKQNLYLIFKESINNIIKHSGATTVTITISNTHRGFSMLIHDNGMGFDYSNYEKGNGLRSMNRRAMIVDAEFQISNGVGTTIRLDRKQV